MQAIRQIIDIQKLKQVIDIPEGFSADKVEVIIFPVVNDSIENSTFNPEQFFAVSHLENTEQLLDDMRKEWDIK